MLLRSDWSVMDLKQDTSVRMTLPDAAGGGGGVIRTLITVVSLHQI